MFRLMSLYRPYVLRIALVLSLTFAAIAVDMATPKIVQNVINQLDKKTATPKILLGFCLLYAILQVGRSGVIFLRNMNQVRVSMRAQCDLRQKIYDKLMRLNFAYFDKSHVGATIARSTRDIEKIHNYLGGAFFGVVDLSVMVTATVVMLYTLHPLISASALLFIVIAVVLLIHYQKKLRHMWRDVHNKYDKVTNVLEENISGIRIVRSFGQEHNEIGKFTDRIKVFIKHCVKAVMYWIYKIDGVQTFFAVSIPVTVFFGAWLAISSHLDKGAIVAGVFYIIGILWRLYTLRQIIEVTQTAVASGDRVFGLLDDKREASLPDKDCCDGSLKGDIVLDRVSFGYPGTKKKILREVNLTFPAGKVTAVVGPMGCGKSTLAHLLMRFYEPDGGKINIDGLEIREIPLATFRTRAAIIFQETFLFSLPVRDNIAFADPSANREKVETAAATAMAHEFIVKLKKRYKTIIGERGVNLSGGQKQRVAIARSLVNNPDILIMDAPTANIDALTEKDLEKSLINSASGRTSIIISQRIAPVKHADKIVVMDKGRVVGQGTHGQLLENCRLYREIYQSQFI